MPPNSSTPWRSPRRSPPCSTPPEEDWPATWAEYEERFAAGMADAEIDDPVREMLDDLCAFRILDGKFRGAGDLARRALGPTNHSYTRFGVPASRRRPANR